MLRRAALLSPLLPAALVACGDDTHGSGAAGAGAAAEGAGGSGGALPVGSFPAVVTRYDLSVDLAALTARTTLHLDVPSPGGDCFSIPGEPLPFAGTFDDAPIDPAGITAPAPGMLDICGTGLVPGPHRAALDLALVPVTFHGLDVGVTQKMDLDGHVFSYLLSWVGGCDHHGPCDDHPSRQVHFTYEIAHAPGVVALCPGALFPGETSTRCELLGTPAPTYSAYAAMTNPGWVRSPFVSAAGVDIVFYEVAGGTIAADLDPASVGEFVTWITGLLGPMPYGAELRVAGAPTEWLGFEHPANILLAERISQLDTSYEDTAMHVLMHEIVHQWAGDMTTLETAQDFAWKEAIAEYLSYVFEDEARPSAEAAATLAYWDAVALFAEYHVRPTDEPPPPVDEFYGDVYGPGPMLLFVQLEPLLGRDAVLAGIAAFLQGGGSRSVDDLRVALESASGADLAVYFDRWVVGSGPPTYPVFTVDAQALNGDVTVTVTQSPDPAGPFPCAVEVDLVGATTTTTVVADFGLDPTSDAVVVVVPFAEPVVSTVIDPRHKLVDDSAQTARTGPRPTVWLF